MHATLKLVTSALLAAEASALSKPKARRPLTFSEDGTFQIAIFADLHYGESPASFGPAQDAHTSEMVRKILDHEDADFVVVNGDSVSRGNLMLNSTGYMDHALAPFVEKDLTWAVTFGNHESNMNRSVEDVFAVEQRHPNSRSKSMISGPDAGVTNYYLPVFAADCPSGCGCAPELLIWFFDSRGGFNYNETDANGDQVSRETWVDEEVVDWFVTQRDRIATRFPSTTIPSIAFVHIPVDAFHAVQHGPGIDPNRQPGFNRAFGRSQGAGFCPDGVSNGTCDYGGQDIPFMQALVETPGLMGVFSGHHHSNSWCYKWTPEVLPEYPVQPGPEGLNLCYGQRSGFGGAGNGLRGARQVLLHKDKIANGELDTWIRLETGEVSGRIALNETYGEDVYPEVTFRESFCEDCFQWDDYRPGVPRPPRANGSKR
ncbi:calcineurin-like phosphoesterase domain-containing protein [Sarocladium implicatum]|nr:calcineurin-like phosphoesterase domain-containing protein [Sarocladium implicatum]